ncbi:10970_t:CDS:2 [Ambispora leptoticha]|uniref:10970_t:CDS:1 n=1 Tax=Ambispora leptoticha TaxID=144679 RepID=A0A9N8WB30_9GLOM|nr:10970_t:CDS:2 [Ambispora leptoticha]
MVQGKQLKPSKYGKPFKINRGVNKSKKIIKESSSSSNIKDSVEVNKGEISKEVVGECKSGSNVGIKEETKELNVEVKETDITFNQTAKLATTTIIIITTTEMVVEQGTTKIITSS